jgi:hypothetical protein
VKLRQPVFEEREVFVGYDFDVSPRPANYTVARPWLVMATLAAGILDRLPGSAAAIHISGALSRAQYAALDRFGDAPWDKWRPGQRIPAGDVVLRDDKSVLLLPTSRETLEGACDSVWEHGVLIVESLDEMRVPWFRDRATRDDVGRFIQGKTICHMSGSYGRSDMREVCISVLRERQRDSLVEGLLQGIRAYNME